MNPVDPRDPSRNLLFGLLAFQLNFIDRRALLAAFDAWTADKSQPLGRVLADQGAISDDLLGLIDGLVAAHLAKHDNEPEKSLAALTPIGSVRRDLEALADPEARVTMNHVSSARREDDATISYSGSVGMPTSAGVRFKILRPLNKGGMGVVSVALDTELDRSIALKEIRDSAADDLAYRARFLAEAEITGKLEHPGIIPIYGLGTYADGRPFYAMRLIRGDKTGSLMDAIERFYKEADPAGRVVEFRGLLRRFLDVCNALSYAHSKGVLHRDLKPDNILLGPYGETLVVDWGLAKAAGRADSVVPADGEQVRLNLSGSELSPTLAGGVMGTPGYAPPEQMTGDLPNIGPRSDVYGLGAVLYCLMTGQAPFSRKGIELGKLIRKIEAGDFPPPRQIRADTDKPLEAICLRAMSKNPDGRYESVAVLASEIERYLADEPVTAYREPWSTRARRWTRKHRTAVTATVAALVVAAVGLGAITVMQTKARNDLAAKNAALNEANTRVTKANLDLTEANVAIDQQRGRAEDRETRAIDAVKKFRDAVANDRTLKNTPGLEALRRRLLREPLAFFHALRDRLQADHDTRPESLGRLADASYDLGVLSSEIGNKQDALAGFRESLAIVRKLADAHPDVTKFQNDLVATHSNLGLLLAATGETTEALKVHESGLAIARALAAANPGVPGFLRDVASGYSNTGVLLKSTGKLGEALEAYDSALAIRKTLAEANPDDTELKSDLRASYNNLGNLLGDVGRLAEAMKAFESALEIAKTLADAYPGISDFRSDLASSYYSIGGLQRDTGKLTEALKVHELALAIRQELGAANPTVIDIQQSLARSYNVVGILLRAKGRPAEAMKSQESALAIWQKLCDANPSVTDFQSILASTYNNIGLLLWASGKPVESLKSYEAALAIQQKLANANPTVPGIQHDLSRYHNNIGNPLWSIGKHAEARKAFESAAQILLKLAQAYPGSPDYAAELGASLSNVAGTDLDAKRFEEARVRLREAIAWQRKALAINPTNPGYRRYLADNLNNLLEAAKGLGDVEGASEAKRELAKLHDSDPATVALDARLSAVLKGEAPRTNAERMALAQRAYDTMRFATAARLGAEALAADPKLGDDRKAGHRYNAACAAALAGSAQAKDDPKPDEAARAKLSGQAQGWLKAELSAWRQVAMTVGSGNKEVVAKTLAHWKADADLAGVREAAALDRLPETERKDWQSLWADVDALLAKVAPK